MEYQHIARALKTCRTAARAAKAFRIAHALALGCAAASLAAGGISAAKQLREHHR